MQDVEPGRNPGLFLKRSRNVSRNCILREEGNGRREAGKGRGREEKSAATGVRMKVHVFFLRRNTLLPLVSNGGNGGSPTTLEELIRG